MVRILSLHDAEQIAEENSLPPHRGFARVFAGLLRDPAGIFAEAFAHPVQRYAIGFSAVGGVYWALNLAIAEAGGRAVALPMLLGAMALIGLAGGVGYLFAISILINWSCDILGGEPNRRKVRIALGYAGVPGLIALVLFGIPKVMLFGESLFMPERAWLSASPILVWGLWLGDAACFVWSLWLVIKALKLMNGFSTMRAIVAASLPLGPILLIGLLFLSIAWSGILLAPPAF